MKPGLLGIIIGLAVGFAVVAINMRSGDQAPQPPRRPTAADGSAAIGRCEAGASSLGVAYDKVAEPVHRYLTSEPAKALAAARGQVANLMDGTVATCVRAIELSQSVGSTDPRTGPIARYLDRLHATRARLEDVITALQSPPGSDASQKLDALDAAVHHLAGPRP
jgi:hypothetical protein